MELSGRSLIGFRQGTGTDAIFHARNPQTGERLPQDFFSATPEEVDRACSLAADAFASNGQLPGRKRAAFLRAIAGEIEANADQIVERAEAETALPKVRLQSEVGRTCSQLRMFAEVVEEGSWVKARIDRADNDRKPPKPDLRSMLRPLGPVVVFGASNFPLAFSVAGGDTASALAAGNPVVVKAHPSHPGTSELVGRAIQKVVRSSGLPEGVFSLLFDPGIQVGTTLVKHPLVRAVGFTGSLRAGRALMDLAAGRPQPIPVFAEMGSTNPLFLLPGALRDNGERIAKGLHLSFTLGAGQFCTKPGLVFVGDGPEGASFREKLQQFVSGSPQATLLNEGIASTYRSAVAKRKERKDVNVLVENPPSAGETGFAAATALFETDVASFLSDHELAAEIFGPATLLVRHSTHAELLEVARNLEGHLSATIHGTEQDLRDYADLVAILENKVGRLVFNGFPTGVEVAHAMVHGGPYPATSDGRSTSVGSQAIFRFCRPVCYQGFPEAVLPDELRAENPLGIWRLVDGAFTRE